MDRNQAKEFYPILQAYADGEIIECRTKPSILSKAGQNMNEWTEMKEIEYWHNIEYRIKPKLKLKFRPFKDIEECWNEMLKHNPFGWVKNYDGSKFTIGTMALNDSSISVGNEGAFYLDEMLEEFKFEDGTPFGIKEKE